MSGIEIDKAKKEFIFDTHQEMKKIKERWIKRDEKNRLIKPNFFAYLARNKGYYDSKRKNYLRHDTSMDYLEKVINQFQLARKNIGNIKLNIKPFSEMLNMENYNIKNVKYNQVTRVITLIRETNNQVKKIFKENGIDDDQKYKATSELKQKCIEYIGNLQFSKSTMIYLLMAIEKKEYKDISRIIFNTLFGYPNTAFYSIIKDSIEPIEIFSENVEGNINIYDIKFSKTYKK
jgi:hypothetical protein